MAARQDLKDFKRVTPKKEAKEEEHPKCELRVGPVRPPKAYIASCIDLFEEGEKTVVLKGRGQVISKVVNIAEVVKRRVKGLHQLAATESTQVTDVYEPKAGAEGKENIEIKKYIAALSITLSLEQLDKSLPGYQEPLSDSEVIEEDKTKRDNKEEKKRPRRSGKGAKSTGRGGGAKGAKKGGRGGGGRGAGGAAPAGGRGAGAR